jgi:glycerol-3-phosphate acyltransferase PlsY
MNDLVLAAALGYLIGAIPFGYLAGRLKGVDLRKVGSGNTGGTNAVRVLGARYGIPVIALDIAKGAVAVVVGDAVGGTNAAVIAATAAVIGHAFPVFLRFHGGKAVATGAGAMMALVPWIGVTVFFTWIALVLITRYVSVASIAAALCYWALCLASGQPWAVTAFTLFGAALVIWRHRANIVRLRNGTENRFNPPWARGSRAPSPPTAGPPGPG